MLCLITKQFLDLPKVKGKANRLLGDESIIWQTVTDTKVSVSAPQQSFEIQFALLL